MPACKAPRKALLFRRYYSRIIESVGNEILITGTFLFVRSKNRPQIRRKKGVKNEKMIYLPYVRFEQEEGEAEGSAGTLRSIMPKLEKVKAGTEQSSCRIASLKRTASAANRKQSSLTCISMSRSSSGVGRNRRMTNGVHELRCVFQHNAGFAV